MSNSKHGKWTEEEDDLLRSAINEYGEKQWKFISERVNGRSPIQCLHRWSKILKPGLVKGPWSTHEDLTLKEWINSQGPNKWSHCARTIPGRSGKQCRERWFNILNPNVKKGDWSEEEDALIFQMYQKLGPKWTIIAKCLEGRTENSIKNRFYSTIRKMKAQGQNLDFEVKPEFNEVTPKLSVSKVEKREDDIPESDERMSTLINQIQHFHTLLENTKNQIKRLENSYEGDIDGLEDFKFFHTGLLPSINPSNFK